MTRFLYLGLAMVGAASMTCATDAQSNESFEIGSYQAILARAGYRPNVDPPVDQRPASKPITKVGYRYPFQAAIPNPPGQIPEPNVVDVLKICVAENVSGQSIVYHGSAGDRGCQNGPGKCRCRKKPGLPKRMSGRDCDSSDMICDTMAWADPNYVENAINSWGPPYQPKYRGCGGPACGGPACGGPACGSPECGPACGQEKPVGLLNRMRCDR